jgi:N-acetylglucosamine-6-phosphate deacetylase
LTNYWDTNIQIICQFNGLFEKEYQKRIFSLYFCSNQQTIMSQLFIKNAKIHTPKSIDEVCTLVIENGNINDLIYHNFNDFNGQVIDLGGMHLSTGLIDLHINGGYTHYLTKDPSIEAIKDIDEASLSEGSLYTLPTVITSPMENIFKGINSFKNYSSKGVLGLHLEGPYLSEIRRGAHLKSYLQKPKDEDLKLLVKEGSDVIKIMTIAPELFSNNQLEILLNSNIHLAIGHSNATFDEAQFAFHKGIKLCTHLFNAMSPFQHRAPGVAGAVLENNEVYAPIIADGIHSDFASVSIAYKAKKDKLFLISDALFLGGKVQSFEWEEFDATLVNGEYRNREGNLAGANVSMFDCVKNVVEKVGIPIEEAIKMATYIPAKAIGMEDKIGQITKGFPARFIAFPEDLSSFEVLDFCL